MQVNAFVLAQVLVDAATIAGWVREGLPNDPTSVQNGAILTNSERWPLMMDPQLQVRGGY
jgi:dynein heavy chain, axonemal